MDITKMTLTELKAFAYDTAGVLEKAQQNLTVINQQIAKKLSETQMDEETQVAETPATETPVEETAPATEEVVEEVAPTPETAE